MNDEMQQHRSDFEGAHILKAPAKLARQNSR